MTVLAHAFRNGAAPQLVMVYIRQHGERVTYTDLLKGVHAEEGTIGVALSMLVRKGHLSKEGRGTSATYSIPKDPPKLALVPEVPSPTAVAQVPAEVSPVAGIPSVELVAAAPLSLDVASLIAPVVRALSERIAAAIVAGVRAELPAAVTTAAEAFDVSDFYTAPTKPSLPKVAVVGIRGQMMGFISAEFSHRYDIKFIDTDQTGDITRAQVRHCTKVFIHTDHVSHKIVELIKSVTQNVVLCAGGMTTLRARMAE